MIDRHDELKIKLRDKSGRYTYILGIAVNCIAIVVFSVLGALQIIEETRIIVIYLGAYLIFQYIAANIIYKCLLKKY